MDVYRRLTEEDDNPSRRIRSILDDENLITEIDKEAIDESDIIMTFLNKSKCKSI